MELLGVNIVKEDIVELRVNGGILFGSSQTIYKVKKISNKRRILIVSDGVEEYDIEYSELDTLKRLYRRGSTVLTLPNEKKINLNKSLRLKLYSGKVFTCKLFCVLDDYVGIILLNHNNKRAKVRISSIKDFEYI